MLSAEKYNSGYKSVFYRQSIINKTILFLNINVREQYQRRSDTDNSLHEICIHIININFMLGDNITVSFYIAKRLNRLVLSEYSA